ncbi:MAG: methylmalonyl-CoA epimerase [Candidatus Nezhaarchaeales archaeon]
MIEAVDHIGVAVKEISEAAKFYEEKLGLKVAGVEEVKDQKVKVAFIPIGETRIELIEATAPDSPIAAFISKRGEGIHHVALRVTNLEEALNTLKGRGVTLIDEKPRIGARGIKIAFIHPKSSGILLELCQE